MLCTIQIFSSFTLVLPFGVMSIFSFSSGFSFPRTLSIASSIISNKTASSATKQHHQQQNSTIRIIAITRYPYCSNQWGHSIYIHNFQKKTITHQSVRGSVVVIIIFPCGYLCYTMPQWTDCISIWACAAVPLPLLHPEQKNTPQ